MSASADDVKAASDPTTAQARLAELAQQFPELRSAIAANPNAYDGLRQWIAQNPGPVAPVDAPTAVLPTETPGAPNPAAPGATPWATPASEAPTTPYAAPNPYATPSASSAATSTNPYASPSASGDQGGEPSKTLDVIALVAAFLAPLIGAILGFVARSKAKNVGRTPTGLSTAAIIVGLALTVIYAIGGVALGVVAYRVAAETAEAIESSAPYGPNDPFGDLDDPATPPAPFPSESAPTDDAELVAVCATIDSHISYLSDDGGPLAMYYAWIPGEEEQLWSEYADRVPAWHAETQQLIDELPSTSDWDDYVTALEYDLELLDPAGTATTTPSGEQKDWNAVGDGAYYLGDFYSTSCAGA